MTTKKASVKDLAAKAAAVKKADEKKVEASTEVKTETAKVVSVKKAEASETAAVKKTETVKTAPAKKTTSKAAPAKKAETVKKTAVKKAETVKTASVKKSESKKNASVSVDVHVQYQNGDVSVADIEAKVIEVSKKKNAKEVNIYYQPENNIVYFTVDGEKGSFNL